MHIPGRKTQTSQSSARPSVQSSLAGYKDHVFPRRPRNLSLICNKLGSLFDTGDLRCREPPIWRIYGGPIAAKTPSPLPKQCQHLLIAPGKERAEPGRGAISAARPVGPLPEDTASGDRSRCRSSPDRPTNTDATGGPSHQPCLRKTNRIRRHRSLAKCVLRFFLPIP